VATDDVSGQHARAVGVAVGATAARGVVCRAGPGEEEAAALGTRGGGAQGRRTTAA